MSPRRTTPKATSNSPRPLGDAYVDGWDMDIEDNSNDWASNCLGTLVNSVRGYFSDDSDYTYYISGAPQLIQFYNNFCASTDLVKDPNDNPDSDGSGGYFDFELQECCGL
ncbi:uncharacterized protein MYCGRDRAFT_93522 [Zymoseptoria tritici IPO323]|uniref:Uncharacterized protein n=1 Tax=Zymoseptoria tritici (strain CBS 115943 / IPO323) TaxID=336722 RepID=F9XCG4_ZYMTI|nr:uncharacterized protein MYCGRDRAFT_93522 [Zymoseptoria tritici IPO323]EGP87336.1 hypothetical protein MYCGRDRAFT_93522 [Zymoseptoria tritici IPO323]